MSGDTRSKFSNGGALGLKEKRDQICETCRKALEALRQGRYRR